MKATTDNLYTESYYRADAAKQHDLTSEWLARQERRQTKAQIKAQRMAKIEAYLRTH